MLRRTVAPWRMIVEDRDEHPPSLTPAAHPASSLVIRRDAEADASARRSEDCMSARPCRGARRGKAEQRHSRRHSDCTDPPPGAVHKRSQLTSSARAVRNSSGRRPWTPRCSPRPNSAVRIGRTAPAGRRLQSSRGIAPTGREPAMPMATEDLLAVACVGRLLCHNFDHLLAPGSRPAQYRRVARAGRDRIEQTGPEIRQLRARRPVHCSQLAANDLAEPNCTPAPSCLLERTRPGRTQATFFV